MHNSQAIDLHDVEAYLKSRKLVDERHVSYYIRWLQRLLTGPGGDSRLSAEDAQRVVVEQLERNDTIPEWQVRQGAGAWAGVERGDDHELHLCQAQSVRCHREDAGFVRDGGQAGGGGDCDFDFDV